MYTASKMLSDARTYYIPTASANRRKKILVFGRKKFRYFYGDRQFYREYYLKSDHWKVLRQQKLTLNPVCEECGSNRGVEPHHLNYKNLYDVDLSDLKTLCRKCHTKVHKLSIHTKKRTRVRRPINIFRHRTRLIRKVSKIAKIDPDTVKHFLDKMGLKL
jgi:5-methylcytosine-specific restriction endonuclease McrA